MSYQRVQGDDSDSVVNQSHGQKPRALLAGGNVSEAHTDDVGRHLLALRVFVQLAGLEEGNKREKRFDRISSFLGSPCY